MYDITQQAPMSILPQQNNFTKIDPAAIAAAEAEKARIQAQYIMAVSRPRSYDQSRMNIITACRRPAFAEKVIYSKPVGGKNIKGPSIRFAELALREWGNIDYSNTVVYDDDFTRRIKVVITDLQTNTSFSASLNITKTIERKDKTGREVIGERINSYGNTVYIVKCTDDELMTKQAALVSKALRNEGLRLIPQEIIEEAMEISQETINSADKSDMDGARRKLADSFAQIGIQPKDIESYLGHTLDRCVPAEFSDLRAIYNAIKSGEAKWKDFISDNDDDRDNAVNKAKEKMQQLKAKINDNKKTPTDISDVKVTEPKNMPEPLIDIAPQGESEHLRILRDNLGSFGLDMTDAEAEKWLKDNYSKTFAELSDAETKQANAKVVELIKKRDKA